MRAYKGFFIFGIIFTALLFGATEVFSYTITATVNGNTGGSISPSHLVTVDPNTDQTFTLTPDQDYGVSDIEIDGSPVGPAFSYTFYDVTEDHTITAFFSPCDYTYPVMLDNSGSLYDGTLYQTPMDAYDDACTTLGLTDFTLKLMSDVLLEEDMTFDQDVSLAIEGGYDCSFLLSSTYTEIAGAMTISAGAVTPSYLILRAPPLCLPGDPNNFPGNTEICDQADNNCNGLIDEAIDADGDGFTGADPCSGIAEDCNDNDPNTYPGAPELCDGIDNNCNGSVDEDDADGDGYTAPNACYGSKDDCNDNNASIHPNAVDTFGDGIDQDCNGQDLYFLPYEPCIECHGSSFQISLFNTAHTHVRTPNNDPTCATCHPGAGSDVLPIHYGKTVKLPNTNNMSVGQVIDCGSCHDYHDDPDYDDYTNIVWAKVTAAGNNVTCDTCHENRASLHENAHTNRVILELCGHCHTSDTTTLGMPGNGTLTTQDDVNTLHRSDCYLCHDYAGTKIDPATVSQAISDGNNGVPVDCLYCHGAAFDTIHAFLEGHYYLIRVGDTGCGNCHDSAPPIVDNTNPKAHSDCSNCHNPDFSTKSLAAGKHFADYAPPNAPGDCTTCHTLTFSEIHPQDVDHSQAIQLSAACASCHSAPPPVVDPNDPTVHSECGLCHGDDGTLINDAAGNEAPNECTTCHGMDLENIHPGIAAAHDATPGSEYMTVIAVGQHDPAMDGSTQAKDGMVNVDCTTCHIPNLVSVHASQCSTCHPTPYDTLGTWQGGCQQGGCHQTKHDNVSNVHQAAVTNDNCTSCHDSGSWLVSQTKCVNCHAVNSGNDTIPPITTSDVQPTYVLPTLITFHATDNGDKVFLGRIFYSIDGGVAQVGSSAFVTAVGSHQIEYWAVDQAGNEELPHNTATFENQTDVTPPDTTSNVQSVYDHIAANITLNATDDNGAGIITTYYALNAGSTQEGTSIYIPQYTPAPGESGIVQNTLEFWSVDWTGNEETPHNSVNFKMIGGTGTIRLIWLDSDTAGSPCLTDNQAAVEWDINNGSTHIHGSASCSADPNWSGVNNIVVPIKATSYYVDIFWSDEYESHVLTSYPNVPVTVQGQVVELRY